MAENVRVIVRCRPMNKKELDLKCKVSNTNTKIYRRPLFVDYYPKLFFILPNIGIKFIEMMDLCLYNTSPKFKNSVKFICAILLANLLV